MALDICNKMADQEIKFRRPKHKKEKKHSKQKSKRKGSISNSDEEPDWVEAKTQEKAQKQRDEWMTTTDFGPTVSRSELRKAKIQEEKKPDRLQLDNPGQHDRELNPYWRDGGKGLPKESENPKEINLPSSSVGDGGLTWLRRAYQRAKEQAHEEGRSLEEVAAERWGSLEKLEKLLEAAEMRSHGPSKNSYERHRHYERRVERRREERRHDREEDKSKRQFYKPNESGETSRNDSRRRQEWDSTRRPAWKVKPDKEKSPVREQSHTRKQDSTSEQKAAERSRSESPKPQQKMAQPIESSTELNEEEMNQLGAKIIKAELLGNEELAEKLKKQLQAAQKSGQFSNTSISREEKTVVVNNNKSSGRKPKKAKFEMYGNDGQRTRYFPDDDKYSLKEMFEREKRNTVEDENLLFAKMASKGKDLDGDMDFTGKVTQDGADHSKAVRELKSAKVYEGCEYCYATPSFLKHLVVATATKVYVCVPKFVSLTEGHCMIVPMQHTTAATHLDEDVWEEVQYFRKALTKMFEASDQDIVFFENSRNLRSFPHMVIECVPLPRDIGDTAPIYFKKAILECETEWSHNKKVVDLSQKDVRKAVPKGLPYFAVDFGLQGGFAHVIEDEKLFPRNFAQEIVGGMLDLDHHLWRKPRLDSFEAQQSKRYDFIKQWKSFDWTKT